MPHQESPSGLDPAVAAQRLRDEGPNELGISQRRTLRDMAWDVVVARIPVRTTTHASAYINKLLAFEANPNR